jgi:hypothetical protein
VAVTPDYAKSAADIDAMSEARLDLGGRPKCDVRSKHFPSTVINPPRLHDSAFERNVQFERLISGQVDEIGEGPPSYS